MEEHAGVHEQGIWSRSDRPAGTSGYFGSIRPRENETSDDVRSVRRSELKVSKVSPMNSENVSWRTRMFSVIMIIGDMYR